MRLRVLLPLALLGLGGCAALPPGACDPSNRDVSLIHKMQCDGSGGYRQTVDQSENGLIAAREENALFRQSLEALEAQRASLGQSVQAQQKARDAVVATTRKLLDQVKAKGVTNDRMKVRLSMAEKDLTALQAQPPKANASSAEIADRQRKVQDLEQTVKSLREHVLAVPD
ncbi:lipoprotein [Bordetella ansorpii]|uniref:Lipoprotein n=1 Tax=Bordetella ansorpii TaxID=288768 RepID=A0A157Q1V7_9BORD|nr:hypothetical protein [Bordetella ansorpii]SAI39069.1 lipoprotein [Bordetella ansorpii]